MAVAPEAVLTVLIFSMAKNSLSAVKSPAKKLQVIVFQYLTDVPVMIF
jgi:hypothetical protein